MTDKVDNKICRKCKFRGYLSGANPQHTNIYCNYLTLTGVTRGCKGGSQCTCFREGKQLKERFGTLGQPIASQEIKELRRNGKKETS